MSAVFHAGREFMALSLDKRKHMLAAGTGDLDGRVFSRAEPRHKQVLELPLSCCGPLLRSMTYLVALDQCCTRPVACWRRCGSFSS